MRSETSFRSRATFEQKFCKRACIKGSGGRRKRRRHRQALRPLRPQLLSLAPWKGTSWKQPAAMDAWVEEQVEESDGAFEPLPALLEDEENVSLADVLSLRDSCLTEQDIWAVCLECSQSLKSIAHSAIFQTLCITPDTLAFNTNGNVCFMEQISDDPEGVFMPPEIDVTGNTFEAHIFSLGATLKAVIEYVTEMETESEFSQDLQTLLKQMHEENPKERPDIEAVISLCKEKLKLSSSNDICRHLSAAGRRILSVESCGSIQDSCDNLWNGEVYKRISLYEQSREEEIRENSSPEGEETDGSRNSSVYSTNEKNNGTSKMKINLANERFCCQQNCWLQTQVTKCVTENSSAKTETKPRRSESGRDLFKKNCLKKVKTFLTLPFEFETNQGTFLPFTKQNGSLTRKYNQLQSRPLSAMGNKEHSALSQCGRSNQPGSHVADFQGPNNILEELSPEATCLYECHMAVCDEKKANIPSFSHTVSEPLDNCKPNESRIQENYETWEYSCENTPSLNEDFLLHANQRSTEHNENGCHSAMISFPEENCSKRNGYSIEDIPYESRESEMENNEQCVFLKHLLTQYGKPLKDYELWALCHECLLTLETYSDYPAYLCLDYVVINYDGSVLFVPPSSKGSYDVFYLAPETAEEDFVPEKVCIYCITAILWRAAKCNFPPDHKLVLPRKLKNFLLDMARKKSEDRPSLSDAIKICNNYLLEQSLNSKKILKRLINYAFQSVINSADDNLGFLPMSHESKLIAVKGPVPCQLSLKRENVMLPNAFTSSATHFKPIILHQNTDVKKDSFASVVAHGETTAERAGPVDEKHTTYLNIDAKTQQDGGPDLLSDCVASGMLEHSKRKTEIFLQHHPEEQYTNANLPMPKLPLLSESSCVSQEECNEQTPSSDLSDCTVGSSMTFINNFLLKQDPETRVLTLVPVQIAVSEQIPNKPLHSKTAYSCSSLHVLLSDSVRNYDAGKAVQQNSSGCSKKDFKRGNIPNECWGVKAKINSLSSTVNKKETQSERNKFLTFCEESDTDSESSVPLSDLTSHAYVGQNPTSPFILETSYHSNQVNEDLLKKVVCLIQDELAFGSCQENTDNTLDIGKYILSLKDLKYNTFCNVISEKFCDVHWEEELLANLYDAVNGGTPPSVRMDETKSSNEVLQSPNKCNDLQNATEEANDVQINTVNTDGVDTDDISKDNNEKEIRLQNVIDGRKTEGEDLRTSTHCITPDFQEEGQKVVEKMEENIDNRSPSLSELSGLCPGWTSAFYGSECFSLEVHNYIRKLGKRKANGTQNIDAKKVELEQLIMIEGRNYRKSIRFYQKLLGTERRSKGGEVKTMLPKLRGQLEEMKSKVQFLELVKKYLQISYAEKWGVEPCNLLTVVNMTRNETLNISSLDDILLFYNISEKQYKAQHNANQNRPGNLQAGTPLGLMAYLYSRGAFLEGYVQQFLYTFRYFCSQEDFLQFLLDRIKTTLPSASIEYCSLLSQIYHRSFSILQSWIEDCYAVDFTINPHFMSTLKDFIISKSFNWKHSKGSGVVAPYQKDRPQTIASALPKPCFTSITEESSGFYTKIEGEQCFLTEYTAQQLCCQLTLLEQEIFNKCHPVHFLNSRQLGVKDKTMPLQKATASEPLPTQVCNLFTKNCVQDNYLLQILKYADNVSAWVAGEIVTSYSSKEQMNMLTKFLLTAKCCYEQRNFATAIQILRGLENLIVRQLPVWKCLASKVSDIMEELKAVEVFLKSDSLCLMEGGSFRSSPTIPSAHILAMHIQQLETGGFTLRNGTYKWTKLRNIAKVVSQVHAFQENPYMFPPDHQLQSFLRQRIACFADADISALAADNSANFHQIGAEKQSRKIQDTLHRMKAMFQ
ncbi:kinase non-catalytic C-lobe domain-containing protein 1 isoform X1 [Pogona vitticeps]